MPKTFDEMAADRDPLYQATRPVGDFAQALEAQNKALMKQAESNWLETFRLLGVRDHFLLRLAIRTLKNRGR